MFDFKQRGSHQANASDMMSFIKKLNMGQRTPDPYSAAKNPNVPSKRQASAPGQRGPNIGNNQPTGQRGNQMPGRDRDVFPALDPIFMMLMQRIFSGFGRRR